MRRRCWSWCWLRLGGDVGNAVGDEEASDHDNGQLNHDDKPSDHVHSLEHC